MFVKVQSSSHKVHIKCSTNLIQLYGGCCREVGWMRTEGARGDTLCVWAKLCKGVHGFKSLHRIA